MFQVEYINYIIALLIITGVYILGIDVRGYKERKLKKERKFSLFFGCFNVIAGILLFAVNWVYQNWLW